MRIFTYPSAEAEEKIRIICSRSIGADPEIEASVLRIIEDVKNRGDAAVIDYTNQFDSKELGVEDIVVTDAEFNLARQSVDDRFMDALTTAADRISAFHTRQKSNSWFTADRPGVILGQMVNPVDAAGIYVPGAAGGMTPLVSTVLMGGIPAKIAGVKRLAMVTPPRADGSINPHLLAAAGIVGIDTIYKVGSAWAVAALAYGTRTIKPVDVIVGPGNIYVTIAKKIVSGMVGIDMLAGPSEILVIADKHANPEFIAADLLSQAEHDILASSVCITPDAQLAERISAYVKERLAGLARRDIAQQSINSYGGIMVVPDMDTAVAIANKIAPEHLELCVKEPFEMISEIRNAGAVFMGEFTPEPVGDYIAGPNHVLPTGGTARFSSALSVEVFTKKTSVVYYSRAAFFEDADNIRLLADTEGLDAHAASVNVRLTDS
ncbi:MAG: histidinol dehydrogenase [Deltaproteobacteria bacterium]|nr:histidinol dehydrogenase [Deltaproteobacteria bacterium]